MMDHFVIWRMKGGRRWLMSVDMEHYDMWYGFHRPVRMLLEA